MMQKTFVILGDSVCSGVMTDPATGRYTLCRNTFAAALKARGAEVRNLSVPGSTSRDGLEKIKKTAPIPGAVLLIGFGGNDSDLDWAAVSREPDRVHPAKVPLEEYRDNLRQIIRYARSCGMDPVVCLPIPVVYERFFQHVCKDLDQAAVLRYLGSPDRIYRWQEQWAFAAQETALQERCPIWNVRGLFLRPREWRDLMGPDGIHPSEKGYALMAENVPALLQVVGS